MSIGGRITATWMTVLSKTTHLLVEQSLKAPGDPKTIVLADRNSSLVTKVRPTVSLLVLSSHSIWGPHRARIMDSRIHQPTSPQLLIHFLKNKVIRKLMMAIRSPTSSPQVAYAIPLPAPRSPPEPPPTPPPRSSKIPDSIVDKLEALAILKVSTKMYKKKMQVVLIMVVKPSKMLKLERIIP